jgi:two-component system cell cycle sensor histidine kinase/response regulator CckA
LRLACPSRKNKNREFLEAAMSYMPKILVVDDERRLCDSLKVLLDYQGYETYTSSSGSKAVEYLSRERFDLVLLDMVMPDISGCQVMEHIRCLNPETLVIIITGYGSVDSAVEAMRGGAFDYIRKPLDFDELLPRVKSAIQERQRLRKHEVTRKKLELSANRYRYLINSSPDLVYVTNREGNFAFINRAAWATLGYRIQNLIGKHYSAVVFAEDLRSAKYAFNERRTGKRASNGIELRLKFKENGYQSVTSRSEGLIVELKARGIYDRPVDIKGKKFLGTLGVARDISDRRRIEARLRYTQKMEAISTLAGGIAHEFNNLLQVVLGYSELLLMQKEKGDPGYRELQEIRGAARKGGELTRHLLTFSRRTENVMQPTDLNCEVEQIKDVLHRTFPGFIQIATHLQAPLSLVRADTVQIRQLLMNLAVNGRDAMPEGGQLLIKTANVNLDDGFCTSHMGAKPGSYVRLTVTDTGHGMDKETVKHIFEPFFTTKVTGHGTGLGLAAVYGIVKIHGGYIACNSKPGVGTSFDIYLPVLESASNSERPATQTPRSEAKTILVIDDESFMLELGKRLLNKSGYRVLTCSGADQALELYRSKKEGIDLVIVDLVMPGMGGVGCLEKLMEMNPQAKVLIANGSSSGAQPHALMEAGASGLISKPFKMNEMINAVRATLGE